jgi:uncharacterized sulfatase
MGLFEASPKLRTLKERIEFDELIWEQRLSKKHAGIFRGRYDEFIRYSDKEIESFIEQMDKRNGLQDTLVILSSDHGENFEHDFVTHGDPHLYEQLTHIPLIVKEPGQIKGQVVDALVEQIDIPATILDFAHVPIPSWMEGRSLVPLIRGENFLQSSAFSMNFEENPGRGHKITKCTIAVWEGDYKLIHYLEKGESLLFDLKEDPDEMSNLFDKEPTTGHYLLDLIQSNLKKVNRRILNGK